MHSSSSSSPYCFFIIKVAQLSETVAFWEDPHSWPLLVLLTSSFTYMLCSAVAHLLAGRSELCHFSFFFLDYVGVAQYQYGSAVVHFYYAVRQDWHGCVRGVFMPVAVLLCCLSCLGCCYGKYRNHSLPPWVRKVGQVVPSALAYSWDTSPVFQRMFLRLVDPSGHGDAAANAQTGSGDNDLALTFHCGQVTFFLLSAFFFTHPLPERLFPGRCDFLLQGHQVFHIFLVMCTLSQIQASYLDFLGRRGLYTRLHGENEAALFVGLYVFTIVACAGIATFMVGRVKKLLDSKEKIK